LLKKRKKSMEREGLGVGTGVKKQISEKKGKKGGSNRGLMMVLKKALWRKVSLLSGKQGESKNSFRSQGKGGSGNGRGKEKEGGCHRTRET